MYFELVCICLVRSLRVFISLLIYVLSLCCLLFLSYCIYLLLFLA